DWKSLDSEPRAVRLLISWRSWFQRSSVLIAGLVTGVLGILAYFHLAGLWNALLESQFEVVARFGASARPTGLIESLVQLIAPAFIGLGFWTVAATVAAFSIAWKKRELSCFGPVLFAGATGYVCAASQLRVNSYQFETAYPFFAAVWGYLSVRLYQEAGRV